MQIETINISELTPYKMNCKTHPREQIEQIKTSIEMYGNNDPIAVWGDDNIIVEGHGRYMALKELGATTAEIIRLDHLTDEQRREYALVHNKLTMNSDFDFDTLISELEDLDFDGVDFGFDIDDIDEPEAETDRKGNMAKKFLAPPFSVLFGNKGDWLERKRKWIDFGIRSELGRGGQLAYNSRSNPAANFVHSGTRGGVQRRTE